MYQEEEYGAYVKRLSPRSPLLRDTCNAFWTGGLICVIGQLVANGYQAMGLSERAGASATSVTMVFLGALLTALSLYDNLAKLAGAGTIVPITGFANSIVSPAMEFRTEGVALGTCAKMFTIAGPVIVFGTVASALYGLIYWLTLVL